MAEGDNVKILNEEKSHVTAKVITQYEHHETHQGNQYFGVHEASLGLGGAQDYLIIGQTAGSPVAHFDPVISSNKEVRVRLYEGPTLTGDGTAMTVLNRDRRDAGSPTVTIFHTPPTNTGALGTLIDSLVVGTGTKVGGEARGDQEIMLADGTKYLLRVIAAAASTNIAVKPAWYESDDFY
jgi:hypothetical protein